MDVHEVRNDAEFVFFPDRRRKFSAEQTSITHLDVANAWASKSSQRQSTTHREHMSTQELSLTGLVHESGSPSRALEVVCTFFENAADADEFGMLGRRPFHRNATVFQQHRRDL